MGVGFFIKRESGIAAEKRIELARCDSCRYVTSCQECHRSVNGFDHLGVRASSARAVAKGGASGIWHYARPCGHRARIQASVNSVKYNGGPLWKDGYSWQNVYWGPYFATTPEWVRRVEKATSNIESDPSYSVGLVQYNVGVGRFLPSAIVKTSPPSRLSDVQLKQTLNSWIASGTIAQIGSQGAYNIFLPPGVTVTLSPLEGSCSAFCDYHNTVNGANGPFYTVEPYPCTKGCNQCTNDLFDTLTQGLSEEMVELKTDMDPGTGWVIGNEELCDFCNHHFVCNRLNTGEYVNAWYDRNNQACWTGIRPSQDLSSIAFEQPTKTRLSQQ